MQQHIDRLTLFLQLAYYYIDIHAYGVHTSVYNPIIYISLFIGQPFVASLIWRERCNTHSRVGTTE